MIQNLGQVAMTVRDTAEAIAFYRDKLGLKLLMEAGNMAFFDCGGVRLMFTPPQGGEGPAAANYCSILYFRTADIQSAHRKLSGEGVVFDREPHLLVRMPDHDLWMAFFRDPTGNLLAFMSEVPREA